MRYIIGIDEVGRGPLAGPVVVAAVCIPEHLKLHQTKLGRPRDSKQLSERVRESWFAYATNHPDIIYAIAKVSPRVIDRINISRAANRAALRVWTKIHETKGISLKNTRTFLDGGLYLGVKTKSVELGAKTIIRGDSKISAISLASSIAKVTRDRLMVRLAKQHPEYRFEIHKGYGTALHLRKLKKHGPSPIHRLTFLS